MISNKMTKIGLGLLFSILLIGSTLFIISQGQSIFNREVKVEYANGCIETYQNDVLISERCEQVDEGVYWEGIEEMNITLATDDLKTFIRHGKIINNSG